MGECNTRVELYVKSRLFVYAFVKATVLLFLSFSSQWTNRYFRAFGGVITVNLSYCLLLAFALPWIQLVYGVIRRVPISLSWYSFPSPS